MSKKIISYVNHEGDGVYRIFGQDGNIIGNTFSAGILKIGPIVNGDRFTIITENDNGELISSIFNIEGNLITHTVIGNTEKTNNLSTYKPSVICDKPSVICDKPSAHTTYSDIDEINRLSSRTGPTLHKTNAYGEYLLHKYRAEAREEMSKKQNKKGFFKKIFKTLFN